jgi:hypothetical protein
MYPSKKIKKIKKMKMNAQCLECGISDKQKTFNKLMMAEDIFIAVEECNSNIHIFIILICAVFIMSGILCVILNKIW